MILVYQNLDEFYILGTHFKGKLKFNNLGIIYAIIIIDYINIVFTKLIAGTAQRSQTMTQRDKTEIEANKNKISQTSITVYN